MTDEIAKYKQQIDKLEKENKLLKENQEKFNLLNGMFSEMLKLENLESIYKYIAVSLQKHIPNTIVLYVSIDEQINETYLEAVEGIESKLLNKIKNISGFNPIGKKYKLLPEHNDYFRTGNLVEFSGGLAAFSSTEYPEFIARTIEKLIGLNKIYTIGISKDENLLAAVHFLTFSKTAIVDNNFIETFVKQAGIILQKKITDRALKESEEKYRRLTENAQDAIYRMSLPDGKYEYVSPASQSLLEYTPEELYNSPLLIAKRIHPDFKEYFDNAWQKLLEGNFSQTYEYKIITKTGKEKWLHQRNVLIKNEKDNPVAIEGIITDITDNKKAEKALKTSNERYQKSQQIGNVGNWEYNLQTAEFWGSEQAKIIFGFKPDSEMFSIEEVEQCILERERVHQALINSNEKNQSNKIEFEIITHDTQERKTIISSAQLERDKYGNPIKLIGVIHDITDRKKAEQALRESEEKANALLKAIPDLMFRMNKEGVYLDYKASRSELYSQDVNSIIGLNIRDITPKQFADLVDKNIIKTLETNEIQIFEYDLEIPNKGFRKYEARMVSSGKDEVIAICRDITERKKAEQELQYKQLLLQTIIDNIPDAIYTKDLDLRKTLSNLADIQNIGAKSEADVLGKTDFDLFPKEIAESFYADDKSVIEKGIPIINREEFLFDNNGQQRWLLTSKIPLRNNNGQIVGLIGIGRDITKRKQAELIINQQNNKLIKLNADKDRFITILAHDIKSPFSSILGFLGLLAKNVRKYDIDKIEKQINIINNSAKTTFSLLEDILMWVRANSGIIPYEPKKMDLGTICIEVIESLKLTANIKNITVNYSVPDEISIFADKNMLTAVLRNLISNAIKFTNKDGNINIYAKRNHKIVEITISDNGIGISPEIMDKVFDITEKVSTKGTDNESGTGLGLLLCKEFIEKHDGKIWVESELGKGSEFKFTLSTK